MYELGSCLLETDDSSTHYEWLHRANARLKYCVDINGSCHRLSESNGRSPTDIRTAFAKDFPVMHGNYTGTKTALSYFTLKRILKVTAALGCLIVFVYNFAAPLYHGFVCKPLSSHIDDEDMTGTLIPSVQAIDDQNNHGWADEFSWSSAPTNPFLAYAPCYSGGFECARLQLPLDYWNGTTNDTLSLAVIRKPARVPVTHPEYGGAILLNPGGPGGSGVEFLLSRGAQISDIVDLDNTPDLNSAVKGLPLQQSGAKKTRIGKYFDLISFDPRGVGESRPGVFCLGTALMEWSWGMRMLEEGVLGTSESGFRRLWAMSEAKFGSCASSSGEGQGSDIKKYVTTASVARDMLEIVEAHGRWREARAEFLLHEKKPAHAISPRRSDNSYPLAIPTHLQYLPGKENLQYWGFSYGTLLGMTFASMYPDRSERLLLDGVVDAYDYKETKWYDNLVDTEREVETFYAHCARVGWPLCRLAEKDGRSTTSQSVRDRVANILTNLQESPLSVLGDSPEIITSSDGFETRTSLTELLSSGACNQQFNIYAQRNQNAHVGRIVQNALMLTQLIVRAYMFSSVYAPLTSYPQMATLLAELEQRDGAGFVNSVLKPQHTFECPATDSDGTHKRKRLSRDQVLTSDTIVAIACTDGDEQSWLDREQYREYLRNITHLSPTAGPVWAGLRMQCAHYRIRAASRFAGPWTATTKHPILFAGNTLDPVTPLRNAFRMVKGFPSAEVLTQESEGHCTTAAPSKCTTQYIKDYFQSGLLPPPNTTCAADALPFGPREGNTAVLNAFENKGLWREGGIFMVQS